MAARLLSMECMAPVHEPTVPFNVEMMGDDLSLWTPICFDLSKGHCYDGDYFNCSLALFAVGGFMGAKVSFAEVGARRRLIKSTRGCVQTLAYGWGFMLSFAVVMEVNTNSLFTFPGVDSLMR